MDLIIKFKELVVTDFDKNVMTEREFFQYLQKRNPDITIDEVEYYPNEQQRLQTI